jgi:hypothetical protein
MQGGSSQQGRHVALAKCVGDLLDRYSAALALHGTTLAPYYLDEESNWGLSIPHLREQVKKVRGHGSSQPSMHSPVLPCQMPRLSCRLPRLSGALSPPGGWHNWAPRNLQAKADGKEVRALVVINPGNPTGGVLSKGNQVCFSVTACIGDLVTQTRRADSKVPGTMIQL